MSVAPLIAVPGGGDECSGSIVYWRLSGSLVREHLVEAWAGSALPVELLPAETSRGAALRRTMLTFKDADLLVRPIKSLKGGFVLVRESYDENGKPSYANEDEVSFDAQDGLDLSRVSDPETAEQIRATYTHHRVHLTREDIGGWLVGLTHEVLGVPLKDTGGVYFVPRTSLVQWRDFVEAIRRSGSKTKLFEIPAMRSDEAMTAVVDALTREAQEAVELMAAEIAAAVEDDGGMSKRSVGVRSRRLADVEEKLSTYEHLLGVKMQALREQVEQVGARLVEASLVTDGDQG